MGEVIQLHGIHPNGYVFRVHDAVVVRGAPGTDWVPTTITAFNPDTTHQYAVLTPLGAVPWEDIKPEGGWPGEGGASVPAVAPQPHPGPPPLQAGINPKDSIGATKPSLSLVPPAALIGLALAMKNGADKYGAYNWRENAVQATVYIDAAQRHILQWFDGEDVAEDSGVHHLDHAMACLAILRDAAATGNLVDNRPRPGAAARLIKEHTTGA